MRITVNGALPFGCTAKDLVLAIVGKLGTAGGTGHVIEYAGPAVEALSMEGRMTVSNMTIEAGARAGLIAPDETTFAYLEGRPMAPKGDLRRRAVAHWKTLPSDPGARYAKEVTLDVSEIVPFDHLGHQPRGRGADHRAVPDPKDAPSGEKRASMQRALDYMGLAPGTRMTDVAIDRVFVGSCTNGRIEDLREVAAVARGRRVAGGVRAMIVPGSGLVKRQAEEEGIADVLVAAGFEWREPGCSMCLAMNTDRLDPGERCASTTNRNFVGRQGRDGRTHLVSPAMAAAAAVTGRLIDVRELMRVTPPGAWTTTTGTTVGGASARGAAAMQHRQAPDRGADAIKGRQPMQLEPVTADVCLVTATAESVLPGTIAMRGPAPFAGLSRAPWLRLPQ